MNDADSSIVGRIIPAKGDDDATFEVVRSSRYDDTKCQHRKFILDTRWNTVECGHCGERVDPFAALLTYAEWEREWRNTERAQREAAKKLLVENLRRLRRLRDVRPGEVEQINAALDKSWKLSIEELREIERPIEYAIEERRREKREARWAKKRQAPDA